MSYETATIGELGDADTDDYSITFQTTDSRVSVDVTEEELKRVHQMIGNQIQACIDD